MWFLRILSPKNFANSTTLFKRNVATLPAATIKEIARDVEESGFAIVDLPDSTERSLYELSYQFGTIQKNNNTNGLGISQIVGDVQKTNTNAADSVVSNLKFNLHTDGAYLHGFVKEANEQYRKCVPPKMVLLQCVKPAVTGGRNHLIDGKALVKAVWKNDPWILKALFRQDAMSISHRDHMIMDIPVFSHIDVDRIGIRYSYDRSLFFAPWAKQAHETFNSKYLEDPKLITHHNLIECQCLIIDTHGM
ncbi:MAG TPA: TauD/TfdA family dioxygenase [Gammaproteobacteria bacterium]|nr:TauD/TfdA family dioxygenase [Gammaproteobacteria bacterium]